MLGQPERYLSSAFCQAQRCTAVPGNAIVMINGDRQVVYHTGPGTGQNIEDVTSGLIYNSVALNFDPKSRTVHSGAVARLVTAAQPLSSFRAALQQFAVSMTGNPRSAANVDRLLALIGRMPGSPAKLTGQDGVHYQMNVTHVPDEQQHVVVGMVISVR